MKPVIKNKKVGGKTFNILFTCVGRRVGLVNCFRAAAEKLKIKAAMLGTDKTELSPALQVCDEGYIVNPVTHRDYIGQLLSIVKSRKIRLIVPTVDLDLKALASNKSRFEKLGCCVLVSEFRVVSICQDKRKTFRFLKKIGFETPFTMSASSAIKKKRLRFPMFLKPWDGYASRGNAIVKNRLELQYQAKRIPNPICQEFIEGMEHTCDVFIDFDMKVRCVVPRKRIETRAGEVSKSQTVKNKRIIDQTVALIKRLGAGPGVVTIQMFLCKNGKIKFTEINPRFGGGVPLSIKAGADFPKWIMAKLLGKKTKIDSNCFEDGLTMLRYDAEVWVKP